MASVCKPRYVMPIPAGATRCMVKGVSSVRYADRKGKVHVWPVHFDRRGDETGKMVCEQRTWWMKYKMPDETVRREKGYRDRLAAEQEAARREREAQQAAAGLVVVDSAQLLKPLKEHVEAFVEELQRTGRDEEYYERVGTRLRAILKGCGWQTLKQINPDDMSHFLGSLRQSGLAAKTQNEYLAAGKTFCNWCVRTRRLAANSLASVVKTRDLEKTYQRRALTPEEAKRLLGVAGSRRLVYRLAIYTGLRRSELKELQWRDLRIDAAEPQPHLALRAAATKARRADAVPLRQDLAAELRLARPTDAQPMDRVFDAIPKMRTFIADLKRAGIPQEDAQGRVVDFHSLRYTCGTWLAQAGVAPRVAMEIMRHTDMRLTMNLYTDPTILNTARAVDDLPSLDDDDDMQGQHALRTGTDDLPKSGGQTIALNRKSDRRGGSLCGDLSKHHAARTPTLARQHGAGGGTRTPRPLRAQGPKPCASASSATPASAVSADIVYHGGGFGAAFPE